MTEWRHRPALDQTHIGSPFGPASESVPRKLRPPSQPANDRLQQEFDQMSQAGIRTDPTEEDDLAAGPEHSGAFVERCLRIWHGRNHVIRHNDVERSIGVRELLRVHHLQLLDIGQRVVGHSPLRLAEHRLGKIDSDYAILWGVARERDARADTDLENSATDLLCRGDRRPTPAIEQSAKDQIVDRSPARICLL